MLRNSLEDCIARDAQEELKQMDEALLREADNSVDNSVPLEIKTYDIAVIGSPKSGSVAVIVDNEVIVNTTGDVTLDQVQKILEAMGLDFLAELVEESTGGAV